MDEPEPEYCYCFDCKNFRRGVESIRESLRWCSGDPRVGRPLIAARASIKEAWVEWQYRYRHEFVSQSDDAEEQASEGEYGEEDEVFDEQNASEAIVSDEENHSEFLSQEDSSTSDSGSEEDGRDSNEHSGLGDAEIFYHGAQRNTRTQGTTDPEHVENGGHHQKFMVCDHCKAHGLPCNEASVCDQCRLYEQPCIHRWCPNSFRNKSECSNNSCRYTHQDSITTPQGEPIWILARGKLPSHWSRGRIAARSFGDQESPPSLEDLNQRQSAAVDYLKQQAQQNRGTLETVHYPCRCQFEQNGHHYDQDEYAVGTRPNIRRTAPMAHFVSEQNFRQAIQTFPEIGAIDGDPDEDADSIVEDDHTEDRCPCCSSLENYVALYSCGHWICHACAIKSNGYPNLICRTCYTISPWVYFVDDRSMGYDEFNLEDFETTDESLGIRFETGVIQRDTMWLIRSITGSAQERQVSEERRVSEERQTTEERRVSGCDVQ